MRGRGEFGSACYSNIERAAGFERKMYAEKLSSHWVTVSPTELQTLPPFQSRPPLGSLSLSLSRSTTTRIDPDGLHHLVAFLVVVQVIRDEVRSSTLYCCPSYSSLTLSRFSVESLRL